MVVPLCCIKRESGQEYDQEEVALGLFVVTNAYDGIYEYFEGRPIGRVRSGELISLFEKNEKGESIEIPLKTSAV